jgi:hypothetical protein
MDVRSESQHGRNQLSTLCGCFLFPNAQTVFKGRKFQNVDGTKKNAAATVSTFPVDATDDTFVQV